MSAAQSQTNQGAQGAEPLRPTPVSSPPAAVLPPPAGPARMRKRHFASILAFFGVVLAPVAVVGWYLYGVAADQYASTVGFTIRKEEFSSPIELFGGVTDFGSGGGSDADILHEFIQSQQIVETLEAKIGLSELWSKPSRDPIFASGPDDTIEDLHWLWEWMTRIDYDPGSELIEVRVLAFTPEDARSIAEAVFAESARLVEELSDIARDDTTRYAEEEVALSVARLKEARQAMSDFRSRNQIVDPTADLEGQMGLLSSLEAQLAQALIEADLLRESTRDNDIRITQAEKRIEIIEKRIAGERRKLGVGSFGDQPGDGDGNYATLLTQYESLAVDREFAEQSYLAALAAYEQAQGEARRKSRYLAAYIEPTLAQRSEFPRREILLSATAFFLFALWGIATLTFWSARDRR